MRSFRAAGVRLILVAAAMLLAHPAAVLAAIDVLVTSGTAAPDGNGTLSVFGNPSINASGQVAFLGSLTGTTGGTADSVGIYRRDPGGILQIARMGQSYLGKTITAFFPSSVNIDTSGIVVGIAGLGSPAVFWHYYGTGGAISPYYTSGSPSPGGNNTLLGVTTVATNDAGVAAIRAAYSGANPEDGLYLRATDGTVTTRLLRNSTAPRGGTITSLNNRVVLNESGMTASLLTIDSTINSIARTDGSGVHELARQGDVASDGISTIGPISSTSSFTTPPLPLINEAGQIAFPAQYTTPSLRLGVFLADDALTRLITPDTFPGVASLATTLNVVGVNSIGKVAIAAEFSGGADPPSGIYISDKNGTTLVALEDTPTPVPGKFFRGFTSTSISYNNIGQMAFVADLSDTVNGPSTGKGLYFYDSATGLQQIARTGTALAGSTVSSVFANGTVLNAFSAQSPDTSLSGLNASGKVAFTASLANGQNVIAVWTSPSLSGDYNHNGTVDAADYTVWCDNLGSTTNLAADGNGNGMIDSGDFTTWKNAFGTTGSGGASVTGYNAPVPEPTSLLLAWLLIPTLCVRSRFAGRSRGKQMR